MTTNLKIYHSDGSPNSRRVSVFLAEKGVELSQLPIDLAAKEQFSDAYIAINPRRVVPTLVLEDGTAIGEVPAIMRYLDEAFPEKPLLGSTPKENAAIQMWERRMELEGFAAVMETVRNRVAGLKDRAIAGLHEYAQIPALVDRGLERVRDFYADLEARLNEEVFVAGPAFSAADITAFVTIAFSTGGLQLGIPEANAATRRWHDALVARESFSA